MKHRVAIVTGKKGIFQEGVYHITQRAPGREVLFLEENDYLRFLFLLKKVKEKYNLSIFCFSLLTNHLHILLKIKERNLDKAMKELFQSYAQYFNKKYQRKGHVFCGVYRASLCGNDSYLMVASLYIHLNAYKANISSTPFLYRWHSLDVYIKPIKSSLINSKLVLSLVSCNLGDAKKIYRKLIEEAYDIEYKSVMEDKLAVKSFHSQIAAAFKEKFRDAQSLLNPLFDLEKEIEVFAKKKRIDAIEGKKALKYLIQQMISRGFTIDGIAEKLRYNRSHIYYVLKK